MNDLSHIFYFNQPIISGKEIRYWLLVGLATVTAYGLIFILFLYGRNLLHHDMPVASPQAMPFEVSLAEANMVSQESITTEKKLPPETEAISPPPQTHPEKENVKQPMINVPSATEKEELKPKLVKNVVRKSHAVHVQKHPARDKPIPMTKKQEQPQALTQQPAAPHEKVVGAVSNIQTNVKQQWQSQILMILQKNMQYPSYAIRMKQQDVVIISFDINTAGNISNIELVRSRGYATLDRESRMLLERVGKLPPPPEEVMAGRTSMRLTVPINFILR
ncbi:energy transducer TonB [Tatumella morbirosei]|nr:energy transducer TonB [Tatumella morbirosei]